MESRDALNARLRELATSTPHAHDDWVAAAMHLGDAAEALLPAVEAMCATGYWTPLGAARSVQLFTNPLHHCD